MIPGLSISGGWPHVLYLMWLSDNWKKLLKLVIRLLGAGKKGILPRACKEFCVLGFQGNQLGSSSGAPGVQRKGRCIFAKTYCTAGASGKNTGLYWEIGNSLILKFVTF